MRHLEELIHQADKPWGDLIAASILVQLATLSGVFVLSFLGYMEKISQARFFSKLHKIIIPSFGSGALLATAVFLVIPEAITLLSGGRSEHGSESEVHDRRTLMMNRFLEEEHEGEEHSEDGEIGEAEIAWKFGVSVLGGILFPILLGSLFVHSHHSVEVEISGVETAEDIPGNSNRERQREDTTCEAENTENTENATDTDDKTKEPINWSLACGILVGDGLHNFCDGIFIGTAFLICGRAVAYAMVASTVWHEVAQEISDYSLLVHHCGFNRVQALGLNFLSGFSVMFGALLAMAFNFSDQVTGSILSISAGTFLYIALCQCIPRVQAAKKTAEDSAWFFAMFLCGAVPIGLVLLNHGHCE